MPLGGGNSSLFVMVTINTFNCTEFIGYLFPKIKVSVTVTMAFVEKSDAES